jgi:hypothetical protein
MKVYACPIVNPGCVTLISTGTVGLEATHVPRIVAAFECAP